MINTLLLIITIDINLYIDLSISKNNNRKKVIDFISF